MKDTLRVTVPVEPTVHMLNAGAAHMRDDALYTPSSVWTAMLSAAPEALTAENAALQTAVKIRDGHINRLIDRATEAKEALKFAISWIESLPQKNASHTMRDDKLDELRQTLSILQAEQKDKS